MPNRIIKESICTSDSVDRLSWFEEVVFYRLIVNCDDYGRTDARLPILKSRLFPLKSVTEKDLEKALNKLSAVGIAETYNVLGKPFLQLVSWPNHQQIRNKKSKFPAPDEADIVETCNQMKSDDNNSPRNPIQSNPNPNPNILLGAETAPSSMPAFELLLNDKSKFPISQEQVNRWLELYPNVDIMQELRKMAGWIEANPNKRKTKTGINRFITNWLAKEQDKGTNNTTANNTKKQAPNASEYGHDSSFIRG